MKAARRHPQKAAQHADRVAGLLHLDEPKRRHSVSFSLMKKAAAFFNTSRSWRNTRFSRRSRESSSRSDEVRPSLRPHRRRPDQASDADSSPKSPNRAPSRGSDAPRYEPRESPQPETPVDADAASRLLSRGQNMQRRHPWGAGACRTAGARPRTVRGSRSEEQGRIGAAFSSVALGGVAEESDQDDLLFRLGTATPAPRCSKQDL